MQRATILLVIALAAAPFGAAEGAGQSRQGYEADTYRFASTYKSLRGSTAEACAAACAGEQMCLAWTLTPPTFRIGPRCELKQSPGETRVQPGAVSGLNTGMGKTVTTASAASTAASARPAERPDAAPPATAPVSVLAKPQTASPPLAGGPAGAAPPRPAEEPLSRQEVVRTTREVNIVETRTVPGEPAAAPAPPRMPENVPEKPVSQPPAPPRPEPAGTSASVASPPGTPATSKTLPIPVPAEPEAPVQSRAAPAENRQPIVRKPPPWVRQGERPALPSPASPGVRSYSVQAIDVLPGDLEDSAGIAGRLPSGGGASMPETEAGESASESEDELEY